MRVAAALEGAGYEVVRTIGAIDGIRILYQTYPDVIIMDSGLAMVNGEDAYMRVRQASYLPIIVLGNRGEAAEALELGADAFMIKPPNLIELVARVHRLLERKPRFVTMRNHSRLNMRDNLTRETTHEPNREEASPGEDGGGLSSLSAIEFRLASCLVLSKGRLLKYPWLIHEVWGEKDVSLETLHSHMRSLREKLQAFIPNRIRIINHRGVGYRLEIDEAV